jgi:hypothetical protein
MPISTIDCYPTTVEQQLIEINCWQPDATDSFGRDCNGPDPLQRIAETVSGAVPLSPRFAHCGGPSSVDCVSVARNKIKL